MAGRGIPSEVSPILNNRILVMRNGRWRPMYTPVNPDRSTSGVNLAESFADLYSREKQVDVGIIPCADGGTSLDQWVEGGLLFDHACYMAELAARTSTIVAVLWHQGESDCFDHLYPNYKEKLSNIIAAFKKRLGLYDVPFILGGLGDFLADCTIAPECKNYTHINSALMELANDSKRIGFVPATGLTSNPDKLHFSAAALREFGTRYYAEFLRLEKKDRVFVEKPSADLAIVNKIESL